GLLPQADRLPGGAFVRRHGRGRDPPDGSQSAGIFGRRRAQRRHLPLDRRGLSRRAPGRRSIRDGLRHERDRKSMMRHRIVLGALLLAAGAPACKGKNADAQPLPPPSGSALPAPDVPKLDTLMQGDAPSAATTEAAGAYMATGTLRAREEADLGPKVTGVLTQLTVEEGSKVKKGQLLFRVDAGHAALAVQQAQAALQAAEVSQAAAALDFQRTKELLDRNSVAPATFDQAKSRLEAAQAAVDQAKAAVSLARKTAGDTAVFSPID